MGCGSSRGAYVCDRRAYHGVAMAPVVSPISAVSDDFMHSAASPHHVGLSKEGHTGAGGVAREDFSLGVNDALQRRMRRQRVAEWRQTTLGILRETQRGHSPRPRYDFLTKFGACQLGLVDELSTCTPIGDTTLSEGATRSAEQSLPSSLSTSGCTTFVNHASTRTDAERAAASFCVNEVALRSVSTGPQGSCCAASLTRTTHVTAPVDPCVTPTKEMRALRRYTLRSCNNGHRHRVKLVLFVPQGDVLLSCSTVDCHVTVYHAHLQAEVGRLVGHDDVVLGGAVSPDGRMVATASRDGTAILWELPSCKQRRSLPHPTAVHACRFSSHGTEVATACGDGLCRVWTWSDTDTVHTLVSLATGFDGPLTALAYAREDRQLIAGEAGGTVFVWDRQRFGAAAALFTHHRSAVLSVDASHVQHDVVATADERSVFVWNCRTLEVLHCVDVDQCCVSRKALRHTGAASIAPAAETAAAAAAAAAAPHVFYWTAVRLIDTHLGLVVVAAASDKCAHIFQMRSSDNDDASPAASTAKLTEALSLPFPSSLSSLDVGASHLVALGDTRGNRHILALL